MEGWRDEAVQTFGVKGGLGEVEETQSFAEATHLLDEVSHTYIRGEMSLKQT